MRIFTAAAVVAALGIAGAASAQQTRTLNLTPSGISVRGGIVFPSDKALQDVSKTLIGLGVDYQLPAPLIKGGETFIAFDYYAHKIAGEGGHAWPITINQRIYTGGSEANRRTYFFLGAGIAFIDVTNSDTAVAFRGGFGTEVSDRIFAEVAGTLTDKAGGSRANAVGLYVGYRF